MGEEEEEQVGSNNWGKLQQKRKANGSNCLLIWTLSQTQIPSAERMVGMAAARRDRVDIFSNRGSSISHSFTYQASIYMPCKIVVFMIFYLYSVFMSIYRIIQNWNESSVSMSVPRGL